MVVVRRLVSIQSRATSLVRSHLKFSKSESVADYYPCVYLSFNYSETLAILASEVRPP